MSLTWPRSPAVVSHGTLCFRRMPRPRFRVWMVLWHPHGTASFGDQCPVGQLAAVPRVPRARPRWKINLPRRRAIGSSLRVTHSGSRSRDERESLERVERRVEEAVTEAT